MYICLIKICKSSLFLSLSVISLSSSKTEAIIVINIFSDSVMPNFSFCIWLPALLYISVVICINSNTESLHIILIDFSNNSRKKLKEADIPIIAVCSDFVALVVVIPDCVCICNICRYLPFPTFCISCLLDWY